MIKLVYNNFNDEVSQKRTPAILNEFPDNQLSVMATKFGT